VGYSCFMLRREASEGGLFPVLCSEERPLRAVIPVLCPERRPLRVVIPCFIPKRETRRRDTLPWYASLPCSHPVHPGIYASLHAHGPVPASPLITSLITDRSCMQG